MVMFREKSLIIGIPLIKLWLLIIPDSTKELEYFMLDISQMSQWKQILTGLLWENQLNLLLVEDLNISNIPHIERL